ncbi:MAG: substrate-binding domain-containing protein [Bacteriovoracaceae bacterium]
MILLSCLTINHSWGFSKHLYSIELERKLFLRHRQSLFIAEFQQKNPLLKFQITYGHTAEMQRLLQERSLDMAFFDSFETDASIVLTPVYRETVELCVSKKYYDFLKKKKRKHDKEFFESLNYIAYLKDTPVIQQWLQFHFKGKKPNLNVVATLMDVQGIEKLVLNHVGAGVLPNYRLSTLGKKQKEIVKLKGPKGKLENQISLAFLKDRRHDLASREVIDFFINKIH